MRYTPTYHMHRTDTYLIARGSSSPAPAAAHAWKRSDPSTSVSEASSGCNSQSALHRSSEISAAALDGEPLEQLVGDRVHLIRQPVEHALGQRRRLGADGGAARGGGAAAEQRHEGADEAELAVERPARPPSRAGPSS